MKWDYIKRETRFPFRTRIGDHVITVTGLHYSGAAYETDGYGLLPLNIIPLEPIDPAPEMPRFCAESTAIESGRKKTWQKTGFFKTGEIQHGSPDEKASRARRFLEEVLIQPLPAREVFRLGAKRNIPVKAIKRAKRKLRVKSICITGLRRTGRWVWLCPVLDA